MDQYTILIYFLPLGAVIALVSMFAGSLLSYRTPETKAKRQAYECGEELFGDARIQFKVGYYLFALLFLVFDVESLFLFPAMRVFRETVAAGNTVLVLADLGVFVAILSAGLAYAWKKGALKWD